MAAMIELDSDGFTSSLDRVDWCAVERIVAYKVDLLTIDMICISFSLERGGAEIEITEEHEGWSSLLVALNDRFGVGDKWWSDVAFPAFRTNETLLWSRDK